MKGLAGKLVAGLLATGLSAFALTALRGDARACGGLFCNAPPPDPFAPLPVAQNGENVAFSITKDPAGGAPTLQAHIQILYTGDADKFSWVVPVDAAPDLSTGTDRLFSVLASATRPTFTTTSVIDGTCLPPPQVPTGAGGGFGAAGTTGTAGTTGAAGAGGGGVTVSFQGAVGPFDAAVIRSDDPVALKMWLSDNEYFVTDAASALIDAYVRENKYFVALKLLNGVGVSAIQPIVLTFRGVEACVPLRLTAIAANPDMPVLVWVLGERRVVPRGYFEMEIDEAQIDWLRNGTNYFGPTGLVSRAANEAGGNAFVTEYAGASSILRGQVYTAGQINLTTLQTAMTPPVYVNQLVSMGLANDPLMLGLLSRYIPMPEAVRAMGITERQFYSNINLYWTQFSFPPYDLAGLTNAISASIVTPRMQAQTMIDAHPYLTRLNTYISPEEMTKDPFFFETRDLGDVPRARTATLSYRCGNMEYMFCNAPVFLVLRDGRTIWLRAGSKGTTCDGRPLQMPNLSSVPVVAAAYERDLVGEGDRVIDNIGEINSAIASHNQRLQPGSAGSGGGAGGGGGATGGGGPTGGGGAGGATGGAGVTGSAGSSATGTAGTDGGVAGPKADGGDGCGCSAGASTPGANGAHLLLIAALVGWRFRRRR